ncbi:hypothetical protein AUJ29_00100 [Candidatus Kuenenbacteria bacterium CG1_02_38_13]|uniref:DUF2304 domain-containing protein n=1 Tax=Candidatus Kuenenbacteria bacterium CG1_02_38_13 TaxID=1805235 RepID=A0A1J4U1I5_9BACT|nr:MAG: hypothetical protein AUJ29_00100 [Candidatus Kuenenbacteria bacterium CG1_02_38_13]
MNLTVLPIAFSVLAVLVIISRIVRFIRKEQGQTLFKLLTTIGVWGSISYISLFPNHIRFVSRQLGFGENLNTFIFFGFVAIFVILFRFLAIFENNERLLTEIIRKQALKGFINRS